MLCKKLDLFFTVGKRVFYLFLFLQFGGNNRVIGCPGLWKVLSTQVNILLEIVTSVFRINIHVSCIIFPYGVEGGTEGLTCAEHTFHH